MADLAKQLNEHLNKLQADTTKQLDERLFESCALALPRTLSPNDLTPIVIKLSDIIPQLHQDPTTAINLLMVLLEPFTFSDVLSIGKGVDFVAGLDVRAAPYNRLLLALLKKAASRASDAATVANQPETVAALIRLWLCTPDTGIASEAGGVLLALLKIDAEPSRDTIDNGLAGKGQGLMWKRVFQDPDVYSILFDICSLKSKASLDLSKSQRTLAQARLLEWLPRIGFMRWSAITKTTHPEIERPYTSGKGDGLLYFASTCMVDIKDDVLMHRCLVDFFADLITTVTSKEGCTNLAISVSLDFMLENNLHAQASKYYLDPTNPKHDQLDQQFLYGSSANYVAAYATTYPQHFTASSMKSETLRRLNQTLEISPSRWAHAESPKYDLHVLASLPRACLLPGRDGTRAWPSSPVSLLPSKFTNPDVLQTLATLFYGPVKNETITYPVESPMTSKVDPVPESEAQAARALYYLYLNYNPRFFEDLVSHAETVALKDTALSAIYVITKIINSNWASVPESGQGEESATITEADLSSWLPSPPTATPPSGVLAILTPPSLEYTLPYLLKPAQAFANLVGGRGDSESAAYKIATAKFDALTALHDRLKVYAEREPGQGYEDILETLRKRITQGPWSREPEVGGQIATMEL